jgi:hypothetical protein
VSRADFWMVMFLAVALKLPLIGLFMAIWYAAAGRQAQPSHAAGRQDGALWLLWDADHGRVRGRRPPAGDADRVTHRAGHIRRRDATGREELAQRIDTSSSRRAPGCGEPAAWVTIEPLAPAAARAIDPVGPRG